jgi:hypothetical protein
LCFGSRFYAFFTGSPARLDGPKRPEAEEPRENGEAGIGNEEPARVKLNGFIRLGLDMNLAAVLGFCLLTWGFWASSPNLCTAHAAQQPATAAASNSASQQTTSPASATTPKSQLRKAHRKTTTYADCSTAPAALNPTPGASNGSAKTAATTQTGSAGTTPADAGTSNSAKTSAGSNTAAKPCPPPKKIVRNGGAEEPDIQLLGGTQAGKAASERSTEELTAATEENLKKISGRQLSSAEQETLAQIKQFMEQSKQAVAAGDAERGHDLAQKARLLSDEMIKP